MTYRKEAKGPRYRWRTADDTVKAFSIAVQQAFGLSVDDPRSAGIVGYHIIVVGPVYAKASYDGQVHIEGSPGAILFSGGKLAHRMRELLHET